MDLGTGLLAQQPLSVHFGTSLDVFVAGRAELSLTIRPDMLQQHGFVHGGVLAYLADNALTFAGGSVLGDSLTVEFKLNYLRPARPGSKLRAVATVVGSGSTNAVCRCDVFVDGPVGDVLCATAQGTIQKAREKS
jgi:uncharacterized protein (TIGR00369 family)